MLAIKGQAPLVPVILYNKPKLFRKNYLYVGKPFDFAEHYGSRLDTPKLDAAGGEVALQMKSAQEELRDMVANKSWKKKKR